MKAVLLAAATCGLVACSGGGDSATLGAPANTLMVMVVTDQGTALSGIDVVLHGLDEQSVERVVPTDDAGVADFGDIGRSTVTVTAGWQQGDGLELHTHVAVPGGQRRFVFSEGFSFSVDETASAQFTLAAAGDTEAILTPGGAGDQDLSDGQADFEDFLVAGPDAGPLSSLGDDGSLSLLAFTVDADQRLSQYGFLLDQPFSDGANYQGSIDRTAEPLAWTADTSEDIPILVFADRKGVRYFLGQRDDERATSGFPVMRAFPGDYFVAFSGIFPVSDADPVVVWSRDHDTLPAQLDIDFADFSLAELRYDAQAQQYTWQTSGAGHDALLLTRAEASDNGSRGSRWEIRLPPYRNSVVLPALPPDYEAGTRRAGDGDGASLTAVDRTRAAGYAAFDAGVSASTGFDRASFGVDLVAIVEPGSDPEPEPPGGGEPGEDPLLPGLPDLPFMR